SAPILRPPLPLRPPYATLFRPPPRQPRHRPRPPPRLPLPHGPLVRPGPQPPRPRHLPLRHPPRPRRAGTGHRPRPGHLRLRGRRTVQQPRRTALATLHHPPTAGTGSPRRPLPKPARRPLPRLIRQGRGVPEARCDPLSRRGPPRRPQRSGHGTALLGHRAATRRRDPRRRRAPLHLGVRPGRRRPPRTHLPLGHAT